MVMSLCRLYDNPSKKYTTRCIRQLYEFAKMSDYKMELKVPSNLALSELKHLLSFPDMFEYLQSQTDTDFNKSVIQYLETIEVNDPIRPSISKVRGIRDKFLGHNEDVQLDTYIPYKNIEILIDHAKEVLSFFSRCYSGVRLTMNGNFYLSHESLDWATDFKSFIEDNSA